MRHHGHASKEKQRTRPSGDSAEVLTNSSRRKRVVWFKNLVLSPFGNFWRRKHYFLLMIHVSSIVEYRMTFFKITSSIGNEAETFPRCIHLHSTCLMTRIETLENLFALSLDNMSSSKSTFYCPVPSKLTWSWNTLSWTLVRDFDFFIITIIQSHSCSQTKWQTTCIEFSFSIKYNLADIALLYSITIIEDIGRKSHRSLYFYDCHQSHSHISLSLTVNCQNVQWMKSITDLRRSHIRSRLTKRSFSTLCGWNKYTSTKFIDAISESRRVHEKWRYHWWLENVPADVISQSWWKQLPPPPAYRYRTAFEICEQLHREVRSYFCLSFSISVDPCDWLLYLW